MSKEIKLKPLETWKPYQIDEVFNLYRGKRYKKEDHVQGSYRYISSKDKNNGVDGYVDVQAGMSIYSNVLGVNNSGSVCKVFYHDKPSVFSDHVTVMELKNTTMNKYIGMFLIPIIEKLKPKYLFAREMNNERLKKEYIKLPSKDGEPDWEYMEEYIKYLEQKHLPKLEKLKKSKNEEKIDLVSIKEWGEFSIGRLFDLKNGIKYPAEDRIKGNIPLVSTTSENNGISDKIELRDGIYNNILSVAYSGSVGEVFYHENDVFVGETVFAMVPKFKLNKYIAMFLIVVLRRNNLRYDYGRKIKGTKYIDDLIKLPSKNDEPDWEYMENYIKSLVYSGEI